MGRFINADSYASTGQGVLGNNMFAYCLNTPVCRKDIIGTESVICYEDSSTNEDPFDDVSNGGNGRDNSAQGGSNSELFNLNGLKNSNYVYKRGWTMDTIKQATTNATTPIPMP